MKTTYQGDATTGGSIEKVMGGSTSYSSYATPSAVVIRWLVAYKNSGIAQNVNFFMSDGSKVVFDVDSEGQVANVSVNDSFTDTTGNCDIIPGSYVMCRAQSRDYRPISGTSAPVLVINASLQRGAYLSR